MECVITKSEEMMLKFYFEKLSEFRKEVMDYKNNMNTIVFSNSNASYSKSSKDVVYLINNLLVSINNLEEALANDYCALTNDNIVALLGFSFKHLKLSDQQLLDILSYVMKRNLGQSGFEYNLKTYREAHLSIKEHYFDKQNPDGTVQPLNLDDIEQIKSSFQSLGINKRFIQKLVKVISLNVLDTKLEFDTDKQTKKEKNAIYKKEKKKDLNSSNITVGLFKTKEAEPILSKKEYFKIVNELLEYFSFDFETINTDKINNSIIINKEIIENDRERCIMLLKKAKFEISTISSFLDKVFIYNKENLNILTFYKDIYVFLSYLLTEEKEIYFWLEEKITDIREIMFEMHFCDNDTYCFCKELMKSIINDIFDNIPTKKVTSYYLSKERH